jgi:hypothetical protein
MIMLAFSLPMPPSTNSLFATDFRTKRRFMSKEYSAWRAEAVGLINLAWQQAGHPSFLRHLSLRIHVGLDYTGDISNRIKAVEDAIGEAIPDFPNDRYFDIVSIERVPGVNDGRFRPVYSFMEPVKGGHIIVRVQENEAKQIGDALALRRRVSSVPHERPSSMDAVLRRRLPGRHPAPHHGAARRIPAADAGLLAQWPGLLMTTTVLQQITKLDNGRGWKRAIADALGAHVSDRTEGEWRHKRIDKRA